MITMAVRHPAVRCPSRSSVVEESSSGSRENLFVSSTPPASPQENHQMMMQNVKTESDAIDNETLLDLSCNNNRKRPLKEEKPPQFESKPKKDKLGMITSKNFCFLNRIIKICSINIWTNILHWLSTKKKRQAIILMNFL